MPYKSDPSFLKVNSKMLIWNNSPAPLTTDSASLTTNTEEENNAEETEITDEATVEVVKVLAVTETGEIVEEVSAESNNERENGI